MIFVLYLESKQLEKEKSKEISNHMVIQVARDASIDRQRVSFHNKRKQQVVNGRREYRVVTAMDIFFAPLVRKNPISWLRSLSSGIEEMVKLRS